MKKYLFVISFLVAVIFMLPNISLAQTGVPSVADLQAQIAALLAQIQALQSQLNQQQGIQPQWCYDFKYNLNAQSRGKEVGQLQTALEKEGFEIDAYEKTNQIFDESTADAVIGFQQKYKDEILAPYKLKYGTGFVGKSTRAKLNSLYGCGIIKPQPIPVPIPTLVPVPITTPVPVISTSTISPAISCSGLEMAWPTGRREPYSFDGDTCAGYRYLNDKEISPSCYNYQECVNAYSSANCINIPSVQKQCSVSISITSFSPTSGPIGTRVKVYGNNFSSLNKVAFINTQGSYYYAEWSPISNTEIEMLMSSNMTAGQYYISLSSSSGSTQSTQLFTVIASTTATPSITVLSPNGGEKWQLGNTHTISWTPYDPNSGVNPASQVFAYLEKKDTYGNFIVVGRIVECGKASIHWEGNLDICGSSSYAAPGDYYVRVVSQTTGVSDRSDKPFTLVAQGTLKADLKVNNSDGPILVPADGGQYTISWTSNTESCTIFNGTVNYDTPEYQIVDLPPSSSRQIKLYPNYEWYSKSVGLSCVSKTAIEGNVYDKVEVSTIATPSITVLSPNGGEVLNLSSQYTIRWQSFASISKVSIALYKNDASYSWVVRDLPVSNVLSGSYNWVPSSIPLSSNDFGNNIFKIYILGYKTDGGTVEDKSDAPFSIVAATTTVNLPDLIISDFSWTPISPKSGEDITAIVRIKNIGLFTAQNFSVTNLWDSNYKEINISNLASGGETTVQGNIGGLSIPGANNVTMIVDTPSKVIESNENNNSLTKAITVSPNYSGDGTFTLKHWETLRLNNGYILYADGENILGQTPYKVRFKLYAPPTSNYQLVATSPDLNVGSSFLFSSQGISIKVNTINVSSPGNANWSVNLIASSNASGITPSITVLSPNGGETWEVGKTYPIKWNSSTLGDDKSLQITLIDANSNIAVSIASITNINGIYNWTIPSALGDGYNDLGLLAGKVYKIGVYYDLYGVNKSDYSDAPFSIVAAPTSSNSYITVVSPNGGEALTRNSVYRIKWNSASVIDKVSLGYSFGEGSLNWIATSIPNTGYYDWTVNIGNTTNNQVKIYIIGYQTGVGSWSDYSDNYFTVASSAASSDTINQMASVLQSAENILMSMFNYLAR